MTFALPRPLIVILCWVGLVLAPSRAVADTINFMGPGKSAAVTIQSPGLARISVLAGELNWVHTASDEPAELFYAYCVDPNHWVVPAQTVTVESSETLHAGVADAGGKAAWLVNTYAPWVRDHGTNLDAAALQVAIWAAMYNNSGTLSDGPFRLYTPGPIEVQATMYLNSLFSGPAGYRSSQTTWFNAVAGQDQMIPTPEPASLLLMGTGLAMAWRAARRR